MRKLSVVVAASIAVLLIVVGGVPHTWNLIAPAPKEVILNMRFAIKQRNTELLSKLLEEVSDPKSEHYGHFLTKDEIQELIHPRPEHIRIVKEFLASYNIKANLLENSHEFITAQVPIGTAELMLNTTYYKFRHYPSGLEVHRCLHYSLPEAIRKSVDVVTPTTQFPPTRLHPNS